MTSLRSPWHHEPRIRLTDQERAKLFLERHGCSEITQGRDASRHPRFAAQEIEAVE